MPSAKWDAIVVGAGPAGAAAARSLSAGGMRCLLIERKKLPRDKMCSGILSNWAVDFVHRNFGAIPEGAYCRPNFIDGVAMHFPSIDGPATIDSENPIPNIWRSHFDCFLAEKSGAPVRDGFSLCKIERTGDAYRLACRFRKGARVANEILSAKYVVGADGANSRSLRLLMPDALHGLKFGIGMQYHYRGEINLDPKRYHVFFYPGMGFYAWAGFKDEDIHVGSGIMGKKGLNECMNNLLNLLKEKYSFKIKSVIRTEGMVGPLKGPINIFTTGKDNFVTAGDAGGFMHNFGEGISCALTTGDIAGKAILTAEAAGASAYDIYRLMVRGEAELCLDQFNPLRMLKKTPMPMDFKSFRKRYSTGDLLAMYRDIRKYFRQESESGSLGIGRVIRRNMIYHLLRGKYPLEL